MEQISKNTKRNWSQYTKKLVQNGSINFWFDEKLLATWYETQQQEVLAWGRQKRYRDEAIKFCQVVRLVFKQHLR